MPDFSITDRRHHARGLIVPSAGETARALRGKLPKGGVTLDGPGDTNRLSRTGGDDVVTEMRRNRRVAALQKHGLSGGDVNMSLATGRPRDPMFYWRQNNIPYDVTRDDELKKVRAFCRLLYLTHPIVSACVDIFSKFPLQGMELQCLAGETGVVTDQGVKPIAELSGGVHTLLTTGGNWTSAKVEDFGQQCLQKITVKRNRRTKTIYATADHRWFVWREEGPGRGAAGARNPGARLTWEQVCEIRSIAADPTHKLTQNQIGQMFDITQSAVSAIIGWRTWKTAGEAPKVALRQPVKCEVVTRELRAGDKLVGVVARGQRVRREDWVVESVEETSRYETVYCAKVPNTEAFVIEGNILTGNCKDDQLADFYSSLFFDDLDYENFLLDVGREFWLVGEAWPLGSWNEVLGIWDDEELLSPDDVEIEQSPFLKEPRYLIRLPETLRKVIQERSPRWEYEALMRSYPELAAYSSENSLMPVSNILLNQLKFKGDTFHKRGLPILMRGFRAIVQEEMLNAAVDAVADRLYTPLILAKLGASATDLGTEQPWIPTQSDREDFQEALDAALSGDFRVLIHHFAIQMENVFGRENMPDMSMDFERIEDRILQVFGLSKTMLQGADQGETYAADALNRDIVTQLLTHYQRQLSDFYTKRALIVAEAQEHFDYDVRNGKRYVKMEEILEVDEETGEQRIVEQPKLLVPDLKFDTMTLQDEQQERQFLEALNESGVPVPYHKRILGTGLDFDEMVEQRTTEQVALAVAEQETRRETYKALRGQGLPIPQDLLDDFRPKAAQANPHLPDGGQDEPLPGLGGQMDLPVLAPTPDEAGGDPNDPNVPGPDTQNGPMGQVIMMPTPMQPGDQRPPESDEQRANMPKPAKLVRKGIHRAVTEHWVPVDNSEETNPEHYRPSGRFGDPKHVGLRRYIEFTDETA